MLNFKELAQKMQEISDWIDDNKDESDAARLLLNLCGITDDNILSHIQPQDMSGNSHDFDLSFKDKRIAVEVTTFTPELSAGFKSDLDKLSKKMTSGHDWMERVWVVHVNVPGEHSEDRQSKTPVLDWLEQNALGLCQRIHTGLGPCEQRLVSIHDEPNLGLHIQEIFSRVASDGEDAHVKFVPQPNIEVRRNALNQAVQKVLSKPNKQRQISDASSDSDIDEVHLFIWEMGFVSHDEGVSAALHLEATDLLGPVPDLGNVDKIWVACRVRPQTEYSGYVAPVFHASNGDTHWTCWQRRWDRFGSAKSTRLPAAR